MAYFLLSDPPLQSLATAQMVTIAIGIIVSHHVDIESFWLLLLMLCILVTEMEVWL